MEINNKCISTEEIPRHTKHKHTLYIYIIYIYIYIYIYVCIYIYVNKHHKKYLFASGLYTPSLSNIFHTRFVSVFQCWHVYFPIRNLIVPLYYVSKTSCPLNGGCLQSSLLCIGKADMPNIIANHPHFIGLTENTF